MWWQLAGLGAMPAISPLLPQRARTPDPDAEPVAEPEAELVTA